MEEKTVKLTIKKEKGAQIPKEFIGLFIEDINYAVDGGLYAEMIENRNFESYDVYGGKEMDYYARYDGLYAWKAYPKEESAGLEIVEGSPVNSNNPHYLRVTGKEKGTGIINQAYEGIYMKPGLDYKVSFYARAAEYQGDLKVLITKDDKVFASGQLEPEGPDEYGWRRWKKYELILRAEEEVCGGQFVLLLGQTGTVEFDFISMMPQDAVCGVFRKDLAEMLKALKPGFLRFPGGCIVEGATLLNRYQYKKTLGPLEGRTHNWNRWTLHGNDENNGYHSRYAHYGQTYGIGFYEYFLLCEYLEAEPLPVLGVGLACQYQSHEKWALDSPEMREIVQDYLDLIEFANGGADSGWGMLRAQMGHPEPFQLKMIGVGNEQWQNEESEFFERYALIEREIHTVYPNIKLIGTAGPELDSERFEAAWKFYRKHADDPDFVYAVDEHYYTSPEWFLTHTDYYDKIPRDINVFFGEYAAHPLGWLPMNRPDGNNLAGALAEAAFLTGAARNSDIVKMTCYAPLLARLDYAQWNPDLIWFDGRKAYATPSYYVQQMFSQNLGDYNIVATKEELPAQVSYEEETGELIIKLVNSTDAPMSISLEFDPEWKLREKCVKQILLGNAAPETFNTIAEEKISPETSEVFLFADEEAHAGEYVLAPYSFAVLRVAAE